MQLSVFQALKVLSDLVIEVDVYLSNCCYVFRCYRYPWYLLLPSGAWGNVGNGAHTMECVKTIQRAHVVINIVSNILNKVLMCDAVYVCSLGHCSRNFNFFFLLQGTTHKTQAGKGHQSKIEMQIGGASAQQGPLAKEKTVFAVVRPA